ncbi:ABC transporter ATP-binding protein [Amycolatopsis antarctica]|uniref:ABC transporter ATP-binding protein n=1 Tax=Amycolatopsis antarctica TaxID=1854586 RepID=A0A263CYN3_9PSEU|nr:ABC transporter ATP-binding protein [Amycolatopsis antarctica]OZM70517.1 ABC transporter ATP-binding protein [Amycolatopsis antarctica]
MTVTQERTTGDLLVATGITCRFGGLVALDDVGFRIAPGEIVGLIGPNGSGKSTLLSCLSLGRRPDAGKIMLSGKDISRRRPSTVARMGLTRTFQDARVFPELTVLENVLLSRNWTTLPRFGALRGPEESVRERADRLLDLVGIRSMSATHAGELSGGQQRLLELVMAIMPSPKVVMLDEATSGVNPALILELADHLRLLHREENVSFVIVEHNVGFVFGMADRVVVLEQGRVLADGTPDEVKANQEVIDAYLGA